MLAVEALSAGWQAAFYGVATIVFVVAALYPKPSNPNLVAAGLALFSFVFAWNALALA